MADLTEIPTCCANCGGAIWDNRTSKKNPKQPDFKCKDKENCDWAAWMAKGVPQKAPQAAQSPAKAPNGMEGYQVADLHRQCLQATIVTFDGITKWCEKNGYGNSPFLQATPETLIACSTALFIACEKKGVSTLKRPADA